MTERDIIKRRATVEDFNEICRLFREQLCRGDERTPPTPESLKKEELGKLFHILVAEKKKGETKHLVACLFFHYIYSTWQGKSILLTDLCISPEYDEENIANELFILLCQIADEESCARLQWSVRENDLLKKQLADFSKAKNLMEEEGWFKFCLSKEKLMKF